MRNGTALAVLLSSALAAPAFAQDIQINGASVEGGYRTFVEDDVDLNALSLKSGVEIGFGDQFALGANLGLYAFSGDALGDADGDFDTTSFTLHAMYLTSPNSAFGLFGTTESVNSDLVDDVNIFGIEFGSRSETTRFDAYYGVSDLEFAGEDTTIGGVSFNFDLSRGFTAGASYDAYAPDLGVVVDTNEIIRVRRSDFALSLGYEFGNGVEVSAKMGQISISAFDNNTSFSAIDPESYVSIGAKFNFGPKGGTFMDNRTFLGFGAD